MSQIFLSSPAWDTQIIAPVPPPLNSASTLLAELLDQMVLLPEEWDELPAKLRTDLVELNSVAELLPRLVDSHLLTPFQADSVKQGRSGDLIVGHYRLLEPVGHGGMGTVYRAEHLHLRRPVALKLMAGGFDSNPRLLNRFFLEARAVARLKHPNLISCLDAGRHLSAGKGVVARSYYVMELIPGSDLAALVKEQGALPIHRAATLFRQAADALSEAHRHQLIHRDIKPSNIMVTRDWQAKLLDFGLALHPQRQMTDPGTLLGTVGYMAPEQARNPSAVDARADLFSLGASLYLAIAGKEPFEDTGKPICDLTRRLTEPPPRLRKVRPEVPAELDELVAKLMNPDPDERFPSAAAVAAALTPFQRWRQPAHETRTGVAQVRRSRVLIVDDNTEIRAFIRDMLSDECDCFEATDGAEGWTRISAEQFDLAIVDLSMPLVDGASLVERVRKDGPDPGLMLLMMSGHAPAETLGGLLLAGADDFIQKPFAPAEFRGRVRGLINRRMSRTPSPNKQTETKLVRGPFAGKAADTMRIGAGALHRQPAPGGRVAFEKSDASDLIDLVPAAAAVEWDATAAKALSGVVSQLLVEANHLGRGHGSRLPRYVQTLAAAVAAKGEYARLSDAQYLDMLLAVIPLHDLGHLVMPSDVVQKPGRLTPDELMVVQTHTTAGSEIIVDVAAKYSSALPYLTLAAEVVRGHHERWDGKGYPDMLAAADIPLAARVAALVTTYDALRSRRPYRPALTHLRAVRCICEESTGHFDPRLVAAFAATAAQFDQVFQQHAR